MLDRGLFRTLLTVIYFHKKFVSYMIGEIWVQNKSLLETQKTISDLRNCSIFDLEVATELVNACKLKYFPKLLPMTDLGLRIAAFFCFPDFGCFLLTLTDALLQPMTPKKSTDLSCSCLWLGEIRKSYT